MDKRNRRQGRTSRLEAPRPGDSEAAATVTPARAPHTRVASSRLVRTLWFGAGWLAVALGGIGVIVPGLPTTGFMIIAAACFARCSPRFEQWILDLPGVGQSVADYRSGAGMPKRAKIVAVSMMVVAIAISAGILLDNTALRITTVVAGLIGTWFIVWRVPTAQRPIPTTKNDQR